MEGFPKVLRAISIGLGAFNSVSRWGRIGQVYSVFERTFHIVSPVDDVVSVVRKDVLNGPLNIVIDLAPNVSMLTLGVKEGDEVIRVQNDILIGNKTIISLGSAKVWSARRPHGKILGVDGIKRNLDVVKEVAQSEGRYDGLGLLLTYADEIALGKSLEIQDLNTVARIALPKIKNLMRAIRKRNLKSVKKTVENLVGLGPGLTPSTDDMLTGLMISLNLIKQFKANDYFSEVNKAIMVAVNGRTTMLSQGFMKYAAIGEVAEPIRDMIEAIFTGSMDEVAVNTRRVLTFGETSGVDTIFGVLLGIYLGLSLK